MPMNESTRHHDLLKAFSQDSCPVCSLVIRDNKRDMDTLMVERINAVDTHLAFRAARGLCNAHAWNITKARGGALSIAVMYESTMVELLKDAATIKPSASFGRFSGKTGVESANKLEPKGSCLLCESMTKGEVAYINIVAENMQDKQLQQAYADSLGGLCLPHGRMLLRQLNQSAVEVFMRLQLPKWEALQADLQLFMDKNEVNDTNMGQEGDSWQRAIRYLSGEEDVFGYRR
jgi:hypothetical protein